MKIIGSIIILLVVVQTTAGNVGETVDQVTARYGKPVTSGESKKGRVVTYNSAGFSVGVIYERGKSKLEVFVTTEGAKLTATQIKAVLTASSDGHIWKAGSPSDLPRTLYRDDSQLMATLSEDGTSLAIQEIVETHTEETRALVLAMQEVKRAGDGYDTAFKKTFSFDVQKALAPGNENYYLDWLSSGSKLSDAASQYLNAWENWKQILVAAAKAEPDALKPLDVETLSAKAEGAEKEARSAIAYAKSVVAFGSARKGGEKEERELHELSEARKRVLDSLADRK